MMPVQASFALLHLTDLHFGPKNSKGHYWNSDAPDLALAAHDRRGLLGSLVDDLKEQSLRPDVVLISGDLLDRAAPSGIKPAQQFLVQLAEALSLDRTHIVLVPGNHDVVRTADDRKRYSRFDQIRDELYGRARPPVPKDTPPYKRVELFNWGDKLGLEVVAFNSCEALDPPRMENGSVGQAQRDTAATLLSRTSPWDHFRVAVMHHHLTRPTGQLLRDDLSVMEDAGTIRSWLIKHKFRLVLHGHQHVEWQEQQLQDGWVLAVCAGASLGVGRYGRAKWDLRLGYQIITVNDGQTGERIRREYDPPSRSWMAAGHGSPREVLRFGPLDSNPAPLRKVPTKASVRLLLDSVLPEVEDLDAFAQDCFPRAEMEFGSGMMRTKRVNILLKRATPQEIVECLRSREPDLMRKHENLLKYE